MDTCLNCKSINRYSHTLPNTFLNKLRTFLNLHQIAAVACNKRCNEHDLIRKYDPGNSKSWGKVVSFGRKSQW